MKTIHNIIGWSVGMVFGLSGCTVDAEIKLPVPGDVPVTLSGVMTKGVTANNYQNLFLMAKVNNTEDIYFPETSITCPGLEATAAKDIAITKNLFYPIGKAEIRFFAYSGQATTDGKMTLTAGNELINDAILSNYGTQQTATATSEEGKGTPGASDKPAKILQFRHVMTQLNVSVVVDDTEHPNVDPKPASIELELTGAVKKGTYPIIAVTPIGTTGTTATSVDTGLYLIKSGVNYLVPTGATLSGSELFKKLKIDDYTATEADLKNFTIAYAKGTNSTNGVLKLLPGYSYELEFKVKRLKVTGITIKKIDWKATEITNNDVAYTPQKLTLDLGDYSTADEDTITKVVLYYDKKKYVGDCKTDNVAEFVTLPTAIDSVELYTAKGLLIDGAKPSESESVSGTDGMKKLTLPLSIGGMQLKTSGNANDELNPYLIKTALQFLNVSKALSAHYKQSVTIDMERLSNNTIEPLGEMKGSYDGNGFQILHLNLKGAGLFTSNSGTLKNIRIVSGTVDGSGIGSVGGICGSNTGTIVACTNQARIINATTANVGGICGSNSGSGAIIACLNTGNIPSGATVGGICGTNTNIVEGAITACVNTGMLNTKAASLAGICGTTAASTKVLKVCYWLTGTAEKRQGDDGTNNNGGLNNEVGVNGITPDEEADVADLSPQRLRDTETTSRLNAAIPTTTDWTNKYHFVLDAKTTGCTWPIPVKKP